MAVASGEVGCGGGVPSALESELCPGEPRQSSARRLLHRSMDETGRQQRIASDLCQSALSEADRVAAQIEGWILGVM